MIDKMTDEEYEKFIYQELEEIGDVCPDGYVGRERDEE